MFSKAWNMSWKEWGVKLCGEFMDAHREGPSMPGVSQSVRMKYTSPITVQRRALETERSRVVSQCFWIKSVRSSSVLPSVANPC